MIVYFHSSDLDGHCSGALIKLAHPDCRLVPINYGDQVDLGTISNDEAVFMVDFSLPKDQMIALKEHSGLLIWIDHHKTAIEACKGEVFEGIRRVGTGACQLVWEWLHPDKRVPLWVEYLARYDVWDHSDPNILPFQYGMRLHETRPDKSMSLWGSFLIDTGKFMPNTIISDGRIVMTYEQKSNAAYMSAAFEMDWEGLRWLVANRMYTSSKLFDSRFDSDVHDAVMTFGWDGTKWRFGVYTSKKGVDVSGIALKYGGGGHAQAAGFALPEVPFKLRSE